MVKANEVSTTRTPQQGGAVVGLTLFTLLLTLGFTLSMHLLPQVKGEFDSDPEVTLEGMTLDGFITWGEDLYHNKGSCTLCHNALDRAPDIVTMNMVAVSIQRLMDPSYQGEATDAEGYLRESMINPNAYVVPGYGKKGSGDALSPMPIIGVQPIVLTTTEMDAIIAYIQDKDGVEVTVALPTINPSDAPAQTEAAAAIISPPPTERLTDGTAVANHYGCPACHSMLGADASVGPSLQGGALKLSREQLRHSIITPDAELTPGYPAGIMPRDYAQRMSIGELELLLDLLESQP